eukprot:6480918-Amphidinium_carterae.1
MKTEKYRATQTHTGTEVIGANAKWHQGADLAAPLCPAKSPKMFDACRLGEKLFFLTFSKWSPRHQGSHLLCTPYRAAPLRNLPPDTCAATEVQRTLLASKYIRTSVSSTLKAA